MYDSIIKLIFYKFDVSIFISDSTPFCKLNESELWEILTLENTKNDLRIS